MQVLTGKCHDSLLGMQLSSLIPKNIIQPLTIKCRQNYPINIRDGFIPKHFPFRSSRKETLRIRIRFEVRSAFRPVEFSDSDAFLQW
ncbi:hypothetical protein NPIL_216291 [Nephila pilipes]|uniref:Uncharacterized protein n=1 Tax=Nephila pilipes TaxID=299642 RepID=A0A8X6NFI5_NEPPI|nr:hypothetical protein NPIL_216291 [Nephila pilipes]